MENNLQVFENKMFGKIRVTGDVDNPLFNFTDVCYALGYTQIKNGKTYLRKERIKKVIESLDISIFPLDGDKFINEDGLYDFILEAGTDNARKFRKWITSEVLPSIRKTGGYVNNDDLFIDTYLPNVDEQIKIMFRTNLEAIRNLNYKLETANKEVKYKEDVIIGLVDDIDLATKRQRLNDIIRKGFSGTNDISDRWSLLYREFERKYHINIKNRMQSEEALTMKPKIKNKLDYIDRAMNKIPELYDLGCKIFENDVERLKKEWFEIVDR